MDASVWASADEDTFASSFALENKCHYTLMGVEVHAGIAEAHSVGAIFRALELRASCFAQKRRLLFHYRELA